MRRFTAVAVGLVVVCGCAGFQDVIDGIFNNNANDNTAPSNQETGVAALETFRSADELKSYFTSAVSGGYRGYAESDMGMGEDADSVQTGAPQAGDGAGGEGGGGGGSGEVPPEHSDTTTQEEGVQESDIVKNDGLYLYVLAQGQLQIVQAYPGEQMQKLAAATVDGWGQNLYKLPDTEAVATRIIAISQEDIWYDSWGGGGVMIAQAEPGFMPPWLYRPRTSITVFDVSDHANPVVESTSTFEGTLSDSRMIDDKLYMVLVTYPEYLGVYSDTDTNGIDLDLVLPDYTIVTSNGTVTGNIVEWDDFYRPADPDGFGITTIVTLPVTAPADFTAVAVVAYPGLIYASTEAIYLTDTEFNFYTGDYRQTSDIYKFAYTDDGVALTAAGTVEGRILNQYSMSEYQGYLRIATTLDSQWFPDRQVPSTNNVYVLGEQAGQLVVTGSVEDLAPGEQIYSARFMGTRGYLVTFEQVDPLFTFDLSNPNNPVKVGELKVPGFSTFIVPMGENHLLTVGQDAVQEEWGAVPTGVQLSIFDISDFANPQLLDKEIIGSNGTYSEALYNPKAFTYFAERNLLALPIEVYEWWGDGGVVMEGDGGVATEGESDAAQAARPVETGFNGVYVYRVTPEAGFEYMGKMSTRPQEDDMYWYYSWFTRGVFLGDNVYAVNERGVVGAPVADVDSAPWRVEFPAEEPPVVEEPTEPDGSGGGTDGSVAPPSEPDPRPL